MSANIFKQYVNSPNSFVELRREILKTPGMTFKYQVKTVIHYVSSCIIAKKKHFIKESPKKILTVLAVPFGALLTLYIKRKARQ